MLLPGCQATGVGTVELHLIERLFVAVRCCEHGCASDVADRLTLRAALQSLMCHALITSHRSAAQYDA